MSQTVVVDFAAGEPPPPAALKRMRRVSRCLEILFLVLAVGFGLLGSALILDFIVPFTGKLVAEGPAGGMLTTAPETLPPNYVTVGDMPLVQRLAHVPAGIVYVAPIFLLFWNLRRLFGLYAVGVVFAPDNARRLKLIGAALIVIAVSPWLRHAFLSSFHIAVDQAWMSASSLQALVLGAIVLVIAQVMQLGRELEEERSQFV
jgi:hypothetical protein